MPNGEKLVFERASEQSPDHLPGDVVLILKTEKHAQFTRQGNDLHHTMTITLKESLLGFKKTIKQLDGRDIAIERAGVTHQHFVKKIKGEGMPHHNYPSRKGTLHVKFNVKFPKSFTEEQQKQLADILP